MFLLSIISLITRGSLSFVPSPMSGKRKRAEYQNNAGLSVLLFLSNALPKASESKRSSVILAMLEFVELKSVSFPPQGLIVS